MGNWFGKIDLAYKYTIVFVGLLVLTISAGLVKVFFDRRKLKKLSEQQNEDVEKREERMELTRREKDEGDYFGVRALEAGFYAGVAQSAPNSRANSVVGSPFMSTSTLVGGGAFSPKEPMHSVNSSVATLPLAHTKERNNSTYRDSDTLASPHGAPTMRRNSPPAIRLAPSTAELTGRHRLSDVPVDRNLGVPTSPGRQNGASSPTFGGSDSGESDGQVSPRSQLSPVSYYSPHPPQLPMPQPEGFRASFVSVHEQYKSRTASMLLASPTNTGPSSPAQTPEVRTPTMPGIMLNDGDLDAPPHSPVRLLPRTYQPSHQRDDSDSSNYSDRRQSTIEPDSNRKSFIAPLPNKEEQRKTLVPPGAGEPNRYSEIFNAYYRQSTLEPGRNVQDSTNVEGSQADAKSAGMAV